MLATFVPYVAVSLALLSPLNTTPVRAMLMIGAVAIYGLFLGHYNGYAVLYLALLCGFAGGAQFTNFPPFAFYRFIFSRISSSRVTSNRFASSRMASSRINSSRFIKGFCFTGFLVVASVLSFHKGPGFNNLLVYDRVQFSPDSIPFTMYLNFDKIFVGWITYLFWVQNKQKTSFVIQDLRISLMGLFLLLVILLPLAIAFDYVKVDIKFPAQGELWILNNLFFVVFAEEVLFRGFIQQQLVTVFSKHADAAKLSLVVSSILFGLVHFGGGLIYVGLSSVAGFIYGYVYLKTQRIEAPILVHFGINALHFVAFSYPALAPFAP